MILVLGGKRSSSFFCVIVWKKVLRNFMRYNILSLSISIHCELLNIVYSFWRYFMVCCRWRSLKKKFRSLLTTSFHNVLRWYFGTKKSPYIATHLLASIHEMQKKKSVRFWNFNFASPLIFFFIYRVSWIWVDSIIT